ncbi:MAG TPA: hypothetical protein VLV48_09085, partial [Thermoanaerobaculia bacterium]|nr:hypothetical protein [Thermoanaerobaculia bacterium]
MLQADLLGRPEAMDRCGKLEGSREEEKRKIVQNRSNHRCGTAAATLTRTIRLDSRGMVSKCESHNMMALTDARSRPRIQRPTGPAA